MRRDRLLDIDRFDVATEPDVQIASKFFRGLSDPTRLRIAALRTT